MPWSAPDASARCSFQLPPNFNSRPVRRSRISHAPASHRACRFEFRHESWFSDATWDAPARPHIALCVAETEERDTPDIVTAGYAYYRYRKPTYTAEERQRMSARIHEHLAAGAMYSPLFKHEETPKVCSMPSICSVPSATNNR